MYSKNYFPVFLVSLQVLIGSSCALDVIHITMVQEATVSAAWVNLPGTNSFSASLSKYLSDHDVNPGDVDSLVLTNCKIKMTSFGYFTKDLSFMKKFELLAAANGMTTNIIASHQDFQTGITEVNLTVIKDFELKPYLDAGGMVIRAEVPITQPIPDTINLQISLTFRVDVHVL